MPSFLQKPSNSDLADFVIKQSWFHDQMPSGTAAIHDWLDTAQTKVIARANGKNKCIEKSVVGRTAGVIAQQILQRRGFRTLPSFLLT